MSLALLITIIKCLFTPEQNMQKVKNQQNLFQSDKSKHAHTQNPVKTSFQATDT